MRNASSLLACVDIPGWFVHAVLMREVDVQEAKTHLPRLLARVARGEEVVITRAGKHVARLIPSARPHGPRVLGGDEGKVFIADDFDAPLPTELRATSEK